MKYLNFLFITCLAVLITYFGAKILIELEPNKETASFSTAFGAVATLLGFLGILITLEINKIRSHNDEQKDIKIKMYNLVNQYDQLFLQVRNDINIEKLSIIGSQTTIPQNTLDDVFRNFENKYNDCLKIRLEIESLNKLIDIRKSFLIDLNIEKLKLIHQEIINSYSLVTNILYRTIFTPTEKDKQLSLEKKLEYYKALKKITYAKQRTDENGLLITQKVDQIEIDFKKNIKEISETLLGKKYKSEIRKQILISLILLVK